MYFLRERKYKRYFIEILSFFFRINLSEDIKNNLIYNGKTYYLTECYSSAASWNPFVFCGMLFISCIHYLLFNFLFTSYFLAF